MARSARPTSNHAITGQTPVYLSPVNIAEIRFGVDLLPPGPKKQRAMALLRRLRRKPQLRITVETAETFGMLAARLRKAGRDSEVRINDLWLAAQAIQHDCRLLTFNGKNFADIEGVRVVVVKPA